jgi:replicative DNA helicase
MLEKPPPASVEGEKPVLGSMFAGSIDPAQAPAVVAPEDFYSEARRKIATVAEGLAARDERTRPPPAR